MFDVVIWGKAGVEGSGLAGGFEDWDWEAGVGGAFVRGRFCRRGAGGKYEGSDLGAFLIRSGWLSADIGRAGGRGF